MNSWLTRLFGLSDDKHPTHDKPDKPDKPPPVVEPIEPEVAINEVRADVALTIRLQHAADINAIFYRWLIGQNALTPAAANTDKIILDALGHLARSPLAGVNLVPRVPAVIPQLLKSLRDDNTSANELSRQIAHDVVLVAEVIREANSPFYRSLEPIYSIESAVMLLGQNGLRLLIAKVAFRPVINTQFGRFTKVVAPHIWRQSEKCADVCSILAREHGADPFEAFLAGLMQNVGLIVAFRLIDQVFSGSSLPTTDAFCYTLTKWARVLSGRIADQWDFPEMVVEAIESLGGDLNDIEDLSLANVLHMSDQVSKIRFLVDYKQLDEDEHFVTSGMSDGMLHCFQKLKLIADGK